MKKTYIKNTIAVISMALFGALSVVILRQSPVAAAPFECDSRLFQVIDFQLNTLDTETGTYTPIGAPRTGLSQYNALGYNSQDNYLYGLAMDNGDTDAYLVRVDGDGSLTNLGQPANFPGNTMSFTADFDESGNLWAYPALSGPVIYRINVATNTATSVNLSADPATVLDWAYYDGFLYGVDFDNRIWSIDLANGTTTSRPVTGLPSEGRYGAAWSNHKGQMYVSETDSGRVYQVRNFFGASPSAVRILNGIPTNNTDGASCYLADSPFVPEINVEKKAAAESNPALPGSQIEYELTVTVSVSPIVNARVEDSIPLGTKYVPGSLEVVQDDSNTGNVGEKTDATGDDTGHLVSTGNNKVVFHVGTGASASGGGVINPGDVVKVKFAVEIAADTADPSQRCPANSNETYFNNGEGDGSNGVDIDKNHETIDNQALVFYQGGSTSATFDYAASPASSNIVHSPTACLPGAPKTGSTSSHSVPLIATGAGAVGVMGFAIKRRGLGGILKSVFARR